MFITELVVKPGKPDVWVLVEPLVWSDESFGTITVPAGFETDLASIPWVISGINGFDHDGISRRPAVLHDYLYTVKTTTRDDADRLLQAALIAEGATESIASEFYEAVHLFGGSHWK